MKNILLLLISIGFISSVNHVVAQFDFVSKQEITVQKNGDTLDLAWVGGLNYAQFSSIDYDFDGDNDLFVFDKSSNNVRVFRYDQIALENIYHFDYDASFLFPQDLDHLTLLVDYNGDAKVDLFTHVDGGLAVYKNIGNNMDGLQWELAKDLLYSQYSFGQSNLYVGTDDIPAITDVDGDGDVDILSFSIQESHVHYHQNQSVELYGHTDSLVFELKNECWGLFSKNTVADTIVLNDPNSPCSDGGTIPNPLKSKPLPNDGPKHAGSTLLAYDSDDSGVLDLLFGDASNDFLIYLVNGGSAPNTNSAMISSTTDFPSNSVAVEMPEFPSSYFVDVDFDGMKDFLVSPNARHDSENDQSILYYKNNGTNELPVFDFIQNDFLQNEMIDRGTGSVPVFTDLNEDGLEDLLLANFYHFDVISLEQSSIEVYLNTGTTHEPEFTFSDGDFLNLAQLGIGLRFIPTFADLDNDGDKDLFLGLQDGSLSYYENESTGSGSVYGVPVNNYTDNNGATISGGQFLAPQLFDLDVDGLTDLILAKNSGEMLYYRNIGTSSAPLFELTNSQLGLIDISPIFPDSYMYAHFFRVKDTTHLFIGSKDGGLLHYNEIDGNLGSGDTFQLVPHDYTEILAEGLSAFFVNDIDSNGYLDLFAGNDQGGLFHFGERAGEISLFELKKQQNVLIYPNPATTEVTIRLDYAEDVAVRFVDLYGKVVLESEEFNKTTTIDIDELSEGFYFVEIIDYGLRIAESKLVVVK